MNTGIVRSSWIGMTKHGRFDAGFWTQVVELARRLKVDTENPESMKELVRRCETFDSMMDRLPRSSFGTDRNTTTELGSIKVSVRADPEVWLRSDDPVEADALKWAYDNNVRWDTTPSGRAKSVRVGLIDRTGGDDYRLQARLPG